MRKKPVGKWQVILAGFLAVLWLFASVLTLLDENRVDVFIFYIACAILWCLSFFIQLHNYRKNKKKGAIYE